MFLEGFHSIGEVLILDGKVEEGSLPLDSKDGEKMSHRSLIG